LMRLLIRAVLSMRKGPSDSRNARKEGPRMLDK
jgi:hypothetical protein